MKTVSTSFSLFLAGLSFASAQGIEKFDCVAKEAGVTTILQFDYAAKTVRQWAKFDFGHTNGPFGPYPITVAPDTIKWRHDGSLGKAISISSYTLNKKKKTFDVVIDHGPGEDTWKRLNTPCAAS